MRMKLIMKMMMIVGRGPRKTHSFLSLPARSVPPKCSTMLFSSSMADSGDAPLDVSSIRMACRWYFSEGVLGSLTGWWCCFSTLEGFLILLPLAWGILWMHACACLHMSRTESLHTSICHVVCMCFSVRGRGCERRCQRINKSWALQKSESYVLFAKNCKF